MDLFAMIRAHAAWKGRLFEAISGGEALDRATACVDDRCELGRWLHGPGRAEHGDTAAWKELVERHRAFHLGVGEVIALVEQGRRGEAAQHLFGGTYDASTRAVVAAMVVLHEARGKSHA